MTSCDDDDDDDDDDEKRLLCNGRPILDDRVVYSVPRRNAMVKLLLHIENTIHTNNNTMIVLQIQKIPKCVTGDE